MKIIITERTNPKMLCNFNHQDYPDITIETENNKVNLVLAFLSIDSQFFADLEPDTDLVDLSNLPQKPLMQVLRALYGDQLVAESVSQLEELYGIINQLKMDDYKIKIEQRIRQSTELLENIQILEFCFKNDILLNQIKNYHLQTNLRVLEDNRKFLQLNKLSPSTLIHLLLEYYRKVEDAANPIINNILENYFNRNNIKHAQFFQDQEVQILQNIWEHYHHSLQIIEKKSNKFKTSQSIISEFPSGIKPSKVKATSLKQQKQLLDLKDARINQLKDEIEEKEREICKLRDELYEIKKITFPTQKNTRRMQSIPIIPIEDQEISILEGVRNSKCNQKSFEEDDNSLSQNAFRDDKNQGKNLQYQKMHKY